MIYQIILNVILSSGRKADNLNDNLNEINNWAFQWKMSFNFDQMKQDQEVICSSKSKKIHHKIFFNNIPVSKVDSQEHLGLHLNLKLSSDISKQLQVK